MLRQCDLVIEDEKTVPAGEVEMLIRSEFAGDAAVLLECIRFASLGRLGEVKIAGNIETCLRLIVSSAKTEMRFEKAGKDAFFCRIVRERPGTGYFARRDMLMFRKTSWISPAVYNGGSGRIVNVEYYKADDDGVLVFVADRLAEIVAAG